MEDKRAIAHAQIMALLEGADDKERSRAVLMHDRWYAGRKCVSGEVLRFDDRLYRCLIAHDAQPDWTPDTAPSLWAQIMYREGIRIIPDVITAGQAFALGEIGWWGEVKYKSLIDANVWTPEAYPDAWEAAE